MTDDLARLTGLSTRVLGRVHEHHAVLDSTNARAIAWAAAGAAHGALVTADEQTAGRGRRGRHWHSPPGQALYATLVLRPAKDSPDLGALALAVGLGLHDGLTALGIPGLQLKWPNDVLADGRKLAGILCEARWSGDAAEIAVGFGVNVHNESFPAELSELATSVRMVIGRAVDRPAVLRTVLGGLEPVLDAFGREGFGAIKARYVAACTTIGRSIRVGDVDSPATALIGIADRIDDDGALWVRPEGGGAPTKVQTGDVWG